MRENLTKAIIMKFYPIPQQMEQFWLFTHFQRVCGIHEPEFYRKSNPNAEKRNYELNLRVYLNFSS